MANFINSLRIGGLEAKLIACLTQSGAPSSTTEGEIGVLLMDTETSDLYKCVGASSGVYQWAKISEGTGGGGSSVEIVQSTGSRTDAVMSQRAASDSFVQRATSSFSLPRAHCVSANGLGEELITVNEEKSNASIPRRGNGGTLKVGEPTADTHATTKLYVDKKAALTCPKFIEMTSDAETVTHSVELQVGAADGIYYRRCVIVCEGLLCVAGCYLYISNATFGTSAVRIFRFDNMVAEEETGFSQLNITASNSNTLHFAPTGYASNTWMVVLDIYYDPIAKYLYVNVSGGAPN